MNVQELDKAQQRGLKLPCIDFNNFFILVAHLVLLWWIMFVLQNSGQFTVEKTIIHFLDFHSWVEGLFTAQQSGRSTITEIILITNSII